MVMNEQLMRLNRLLDEWIEHPERRPAPTKPKKPSVVPRARPYALPQGTRLVDGVVAIPGTTPGSEWHVTLANRWCDCPANKRWPPCKHVRAVDALVALAEEGRGSI